jgi:patatin-like phospholipase/acyl hydrolase
MTAWPGGRFQILSLDGGGLKGIYSAAVLAALEADTGKSVAGHFDLITGTSTGGIIALGLGLGISPKKILEFYVKDGPEIFRNRWKGRSALHLLRAKYSARPREKALRGVFGDRILGSSTKALVVPAYDLDADRVYLFKTPHTDNLLRDWKTPAWQVAMATSAAPTYFPSYRLPSDRTRLIDGGVWANNPSMVGVVEAVSLFGATLEQIHLFSLGTTSAVTARTRRLDRGGLGQWAVRGGVEVLLRGQSVGANTEALHLLGKERVLREDPTVPKGFLRLDSVNADQLIGIASSHSRHLAPLFTAGFGGHDGLELVPKDVTPG